MGLSRDDRMGDDLTTNCVVRSNGGVDIVTGEFQTYVTSFPSVVIVSFRNTLL